MLRYFNEIIVDVCAFCSWSFFVRYVIIHLCPFLHSFYLNLPLCGSLVSFISKHKEGVVFLIFRAGLVQKVRVPLRQVFKAFRIGNIINQYARLSTSIEGNSKALVALLSCSIPNLLNLVLSRYLIILEVWLFWYPHWLQLLTFYYENLHLWLAYMPASLVSWYI